MLAQITNYQYLKWHKSAIMSSELLSKLPASINTVYDAELMLLALATSNKFYHLDDRPEDIGIFSKEECDTLNRLIEEADGVTRKHYGREERPECNVGLWEGLIKDVLPIGYLAFTTSDNHVYVYNDIKLIKTTWNNWIDLKTKAKEDEDSYSVSLIDAWFEGQTATDT